jgi:hypothetical protein
VSVSNSELSAPNDIAHAVFLDLKTMRDYVKKYEEWRLKRRNVGTDLLHLEKKTWA